MKKLKVAYFGTPDFSAYFLEKLIQDKTLPIEVVSVVTQEDKPVGRKQIPTSTPVKKIAEKHHIPIFNSKLRGQNSELNVKSRILNSKLDSKFLTLNSKLNKIDLALLYAYGELISPDMLKMPKHGFWNIHPSLLPKYRGPSPVASALIAGEKETGVTLMKLVEELDAGPIIAQKKVKIEPKERTPELSFRLADAGYELFRQVILNLMRHPRENGDPENQLDSRLRGNDNFLPQEHSNATYTKRFEKQDGFIEISNLKFLISNQKPSSKPQRIETAEELFNLFRGLYPWPGIWSRVRIKNYELRIKITDMDLVEEKLIIKKVQLEGKKEVDFKTFNNAYKIF